MRLSHLEDRKTNLVVNTFFNKPAKYIFPKRSQVNRICDRHTCSFVAAL